MLSGGEKALTAVALLFAIFALNPAPFCLLDEVDAALDDANVLRLVALIKEMSTVSFNVESLLGWILICLDTFGVSWIHIL